MGKGVWLPHGREPQLHCILYCKLTIWYQGVPGAPSDQERGSQVGQRP